ncbi:hypothetical protein e2017b09.tmp0302 [Eimeria tenella]|uniref:Uncharacterized protein n=1 Tax=Eimeria tenella TaxID=5802 RepID=C8TDY1_EIMTE|nr:hypothetical protein e2017b09.tmp0302 [Eimeria tenella]
MGLSYIEQALSDGTLTVRVLFELQVAQTTGSLHQPLRNLSTQAPGQYATTESEDNSAPLAKTMKHRFLFNGTEKLFSLEFVNSNRYSFKRSSAAL